MPITHFRRPSGPGILHCPHPSLSQGLSIFCGIWQSPKRSEHFISKAGTVGAACYHSMLQIGKRTLTCVCESALNESCVHVLNISSWHSIRQHLCSNHMVFAFHLCGSCHGCSFLVGCSFQTDGSALHLWLTCIAGWQVNVLISSLWCLFYRVASIHHLYFQSSLLTCVWHAQRPWWR